jgi:hypothetical protein
LIYFLAVALALSGILLSLVHVGTALALACASLALVPTAAPLVVVPPAPRTALARWLLLFLGLTVALFAWRACTQPLSGPDTPFRWNFLALEIARTGDFSEVNRLLKVLQNPFDDALDGTADAGLPPDWARHIEVSCSS